MNNGMQKENSVPLLVDQAPISNRFRLVYALLSVSLAFELFDFFIVGFLVSVIAPAWELSFGQSAVLLLIASVGAMIGAAAGGLLADRFGRKPILLIGATVYPIAAAAIGLVAEGDWIAFAILRFIVGLAYGFGGVAQFALIVELTPTRHRTFLASASMVPIGIGFVLAPLAMTLLYDPLGWRGLAFLCLVPLVFVPLFWFLIPESPSWLSSKKRHTRAIREAASLFSLPVEHFVSPNVPADLPNNIETSTARLLDSRRQVAFCIMSFGFHGAAVAGILLWGPLFVAMLLDLEPQKAAGYFVFISLSGLVGRFFFAFLSQRLGRLPTGQIAGYGAALWIVVGTLFAQHELLGLNLFVLCLIAAAFFFDGAFSNLQPHPAEIFPVNVAARGVAVSHVASGLGKVGGPMVLALLAGTNNVVSPAATAAVATPGFLLMAGCFAVGAAAFTFLGTETHRRPVVV